MNASEDRDEFPSGSTSRSLLADARLSNPEAWERLVRLYTPLVASWCQRWGVARQDIVDVLQDVFSAVAGHLNRFRKDRPADTFRGWLATISRNKIRDYLRRRVIEPNAAGGSEAAQRMQQIPEPLIDSETVEMSEDLFLDDLLRTALESIRNEFHEKTWKAFWRTVVDGRSAADVADELEMKPGTVRVAKSRVLLRLRRELGDLPG